MSEVTEHHDQASVIKLWQLRGEFVFHLGLMLAAIAVITLSFLMRLVGDTFVFMPGSFLPMPESCAMKQMFGMPCPGCGLTRAFISISDLKFVRAWNFNPASFVVYAFVVGQIPWRIFQMIRIAKGKLPLFSIWLFVPLGIVIVSSLSQWIWHWVA